MVSHLAQVVPAGKSGQVPQEDEQERLRGIILRRVESPSRQHHAEVGSGFTRCQAHANDPSHVVTAYRTA